MVTCCGGRTIGTPKRGVNHFLSFTHFPGGLLCYVFMIMVVISQQAYSQGYNFSFNNYSTNNGLTNITVEGIRQDKKGYIWFTTAYGANRFDGYNFVKFVNNPHDSASIIGDNITPN